MDTSLGRVVSQFTGIVTLTSVLNKGALGPCVAHESEVYKGRGKQISKTPFFPFQVTYYLWSMATFGPKGLI